MKILVGLCVLATTAAYLVDVARGGADLDIRPFAVLAFGVAFYAAYGRLSNRIDRVQARLDSQRERLQSPNMLGNAESRQKFLDEVAERERQAAVADGDVWRADGHAPMSRRTASVPGDKHPAGRKRHGTAS